MKNHTIPVQIIEISSRGLMLKWQNFSQECPRCKSGEGCGNFPWFQGVKLNNNVIFLPSDPSNWRQGDLAQIIISSQVVTFIAVLIYGLPLMTFFIVLLCSQFLPEGQQILIASLATGLVIYCSHFIQNIFLKRFIHLKKLEKSIPQRVKITK